MRFALHAMVKCFVLFGGVRHFVDNVDDIVRVADARVERFPRRIVRSLVRGTIIIAHILLPSEVTVEGRQRVCPRRVGDVALLRGTGGVDVVVERIDETIHTGVHPFADFVAAKINIADEQFVEIGDAFRHHEILRVLVEEVVAAHRGECEQAETERKDILFHEVWRIRR